MKVIAKVNEHTVLCEVSVTEIGRLQNCSGPYDKAWSNKWLDVGTEHDLKRAFDTMDALRGFDARHLKYVQDRMVSMAKGFEEVREAYEKLMLLDVLKEAGKE